MVRGFGGVTVRCIRERQTYLGLQLWGDCEVLRNYNNKTSKQINKRD